MRYIHIILNLIIIISCNNKKESVSEEISNDSIVLNFIKIPDSIDTFKGYNIIDKLEDSIYHSIYFKDYNPFLYYNLPIFHSSGERFKFQGKYNLEDYLRLGFIYYDLQLISISDISPYLSDNISMNQLKNCDFVYADSYCQSKLEGDLLIYNCSFSISGDINNKLETLTLSSRYLIFNSLGEIIYDRFDKNHSIDFDSKILNGYVVLITHSSPFLIEESGFKIIDLSTKENIATRKYTIENDIFIYPKDIADIDSTQFLITVEKENRLFELFIFNTINKELSKYSLKDGELFYDIKIRDGKIYIVDYGCEECFEQLPYREKEIKKDEFKIK